MPGPAHQIAAGPHISARTVRSQPDRIRERPDAGGEPA
jgi:hypothetical protein